MSFRFAIEYTQQSGTKRVCKGTLITTPETNWIWLKDANKVTIRKGVVSAGVMASIREGAVITAAGFEIRVAQQFEEVLNVTTAAAVKGPVGPPPKAEPGSAQKENLFAQHVPAPKDTEPPRDARPSLDPALSAVMRPHQLSAATFLLARLLGEEVTADSVDAQAQSEATSSSSSSSMSADATSADATVIKVLTTGAILADDMGTGKTLTALSVLWALVRHGRAKGVVVCPSSLVDNWERETRRWLPNSLGSAQCGGLFCSARDAAHKVTSFCSTAPGVRPLLVISYELFRNHAEALNRVGTLDVIICDEGHRLKNALGTKTTLALGNCIAQRRLVLTGTPVQNNLDELYSVVQFAVPGLLGTLQEFKTRFGDAIEGGFRDDGEEDSSSAVEGDGGDDGPRPKRSSKAKSSANASARARATSKASARREAASVALRALLSRVLLRRSRDSLLRALLPPRRDYVLLCGMSATQRDEYLERCSELLANSGDGVVGGDGLLVGEAAADRGTKRRRLSTATANSSSGSGSGGDAVLPALLQLRQVANSSSAFEDMFASTTGDNPVIPSAFAAAPIVTAASSLLISGSQSGQSEGQGQSQVVMSSSQRAAAFLLAQSGKLQVLEALLAAIRVKSWPPPASGGSCTTTISTTETAPAAPSFEKVVVVSNFTAALDDVAAIARARGWHCLRIDGSVPSDRRQKAVNHFNNSGSPFFIMLLSARAGGVGLNLIGGSRLVMLDPDWNPATDAQAMGRVWRDGQTRPVFIYRLLTAGSIDEVVVARQLKKGTLASVIAEQGKGQERELAVAVHDSEVGNEGCKSDSAELEAGAGASGEDDAGLDRGLALSALADGDLESLVLPRGRNFVAELGAHPGPELEPRKSEKWGQEEGAGEGDAVLAELRCAALLEVSRV